MLDNHAIVNNFPAEPEPVPDSKKVWKCVELIALYGDPLNEKTGIENSFI